MFNLPINSSNLLLLTIFALFQGFLVVIVVFLFIDKFFSTRKQRIEAAKVKEEAYKKAEEALMAAQVTAQNLISEADSRAKALLLDAEKKSSAIITEANLFNEDIKHDFETSLRKLLQDKAVSLSQKIDSVSSNMQKIVEESQITTIASLSTSAESFNRSILAGVSAYNDKLSLLAEEVTKELNSQLVSYLEKTKSNIDDFEISRKNYLKSRSLDLIEEITTKYMHSAVTDVDREEIVLSLLKETSVTELKGN